MDVIFYMKGTIMFIDARSETKSVTELREEAQDEKTPVSRLERLSKYPDWFVRFPVAENPHTAQHTIDEMERVETDIVVRKALDKRKEEFRQ